jgi:hypothetical protein
MKPLNEHPGSWSSFPMALPLEARR